MKLLFSPFLEKAEVTKIETKKQVQEQAILGLGAENQLIFSSIITYYRKIHSKSNGICGFAGGCALSWKGETMAHQPNRTFLNESFDPRTILAVWNKATIVTGYNQSDFRKDRCGVWIRFANYGNVNSDFGWEIDHERPVAKGGTNDLDNLQPLHWRNNRGKSDNWPNWTCSFSAT